MSNPIIRIHDLSTNEIIDREMTDEEVEQANYVPPKLAKERADEAKVYAEKAQAKATAEGKLAALGLTTDDLRALGL
jgi:hypothetical protein